MREDDLDFAAERTAEVDWPGETREVFESFLHRDPAGCLIAESDGYRVGVCAATAYERSGFVGELIVRKEERGRGVGPRLMTEAIAYLRDRGIENIYLDGVARAVPFYESLGFRPVCRSLRFLGTVEGRPSHDVRPMRREDLPEICRLDRQAFGDDRGFFLERRLELYPKFAKVLERAGHLEGFILGLQGRGLVAAGPWIIGPRRNARSLSSLLSRSRRRVFLSGSAFWRRTGRPSPPSARSRDSSLSTPACAWFWDRRAGSGILPCAGPWARRPKDE
jgi:GNAT superfamily N-acetyltransferase